RETTRETILSPPSRIDQIYLREEEKEKQIALKENEIKKDWKKMVIPTRHLALAALFIFLLILGLGGVFSLFKSKKIEVAAVDYSGEIRKVLKNFPEVEFSYNSSNGKLFILGHVLTEVDHQEMIYLLRSLSFIQSNQDIEDNVIIDELVWTNSNALLAKNPNWRGVSLTSIIPGHFVLRGYVASLEEATKLSEYLNLNFPYLDRLDNQVVVENTLQAEIQSILLEGGFSSVTFQFASGELILVGNVASDKQKNLNEALKTFKKLRGVRTVKNLTVLTKTSRELTDLSGKYTVTGSSKRGKVNQYVVIGGRILSKGDSLDGMRITAIEANAIFLEKDGTKYRINYNQQ
ncbi:MAG: type III secretion system inner membrane ring subunit SctD, partial [Simkania negevensis]|nr:type III secretion system inner membrane ring subunit SctD [Simkania negevensis]